MILKEIFQDLQDSCADIQITGVTADSRKVKEGFAFVAIKGHKVDGHDYIPIALEKGASVIIAEHELNQNISVPVIIQSDTRKALVKILSASYPQRPEKLYAVTGTNGKTSVTDFIRQILNHNGFKAVSVGTLGAIGTNIPFPAGHTTPDPEILFPFLDALAKEGVTDFVIEASSHGLSQSRLEGLEFDCVLFTNFSRDHMDYHASEQDYFDAKMCLFKNHIHKNSKAIIFNDDPVSSDVVKITKKSKIEIITLGYSSKKTDYKIKSHTAHAMGASFDLIALKNKSKTPEHIETSLSGDFQATNLTMAGIAVHSIRDIPLTNNVLSQVKSVDGRLDRIDIFNDAQFYVDYAHTPDALEKALNALRPHCTGQLICVFGCGGDRDRGKRPMMAKIASELADYVIITDDNPRTEDASAIRKEVISGINDKKQNHYLEIADRKQAIIKALDHAKMGDIVLVAGKGHENGQIIGDKTLPFKDSDIIKQEIQKRKAVTQQSKKIERVMEDKELLWTQTGVAAATGSSILRPFQVTGIAIDSREVQKGDLFIALKARRDGHHFIRNAAASGASAAIIAWKPKNLPRGFPVVYVRNTLGGLEALAKASRSRMRGKVIAVTGTAGKTTVKSILSHVLSGIGKTHAADKSFNNHIGVPLSLARMPFDTEFGVFEIGMNKPEEIRPLSKLVRPDVAIITTVGEGHREAFSCVEDIARAKAEIIDGVKNNGTVIINNDIETAHILKETAQARGLTIITFGTSDDADIRLLAYEQNIAEEIATLKISLHGQQLEFNVALQGEHNALNICSVLGALTAIKADITEIAAAFSTLKPVGGRGEIVNLELEGKGSVKLIDESYNANPLSMKAALKNAVSVKPLKEDGKKIAVLGAMRELGEITDQAHIDLKQDIIDGEYDHIYLIGNEMNVLYEALGEDQPTILAQELDDVIDEIYDETTDGSVILAKGSNSTKIWQLIAHFKVKGNYFGTETNQNDGSECQDQENIENNDDYAHSSEDDSDSDILDNSDDPIRKPA